MHSYFRNPSRSIFWRSLQHLLLLIVLVGATAACANKGAVAPEPSNEWPLAWQDKDGDCQDTETEILIAQTLGLIQWADPEACSVASGQWRSWGSDQAVPISSVLVVMVVVPANAQASGAQDWSMDEKLALMNDEENLIILDAAAAAVRANYGPDRWVPHKKYWCEYATRWRNVKQRYGLTLSKEEDAATAHMMAVACEPSEEADKKPMP
ncbi:MAG: hypothetical protein KBT87_04265 [Gammaproteobacteria bacterium]|jgi:hypothetical protein|nr:hypothetical protein [Gammaproteobacteria bacterium]MBQ0773868.1 hypothetical protein [Gammaproteobacteria bacterium]